MKCSNQLPPPNLSDRGLARQEGNTEAQKSDWTLRAEMTVKTQLRQCLDKVVDVFFKPLYIRCVLGGYFVVAAAVVEKIVNGELVNNVQKDELSFILCLFCFVLFISLHANPSFDTYFPFPCICYIFSV